MRYTHTLLEGIFCHRPFIYGSMPAIQSLGRQHIYFGLVVHQERDSSRLGLRQTFSDPKTYLWPTVVAVIAVKRTLGSVVLWNWCLFIILSVKFISHFSISIWTRQLNELIILPHFHRLLTGFSIHPTFHKILRKGQDGDEGKGEVTTELSRF